MKFFKLYKRKQYSRSAFLTSGPWVTVWTPWITVSIDAGATLYGSEDEFDSKIMYKGWGPIFYLGNRDITNLGNVKKFDSLHFITLHPDYKEFRKRHVGGRDRFEKTRDAIRTGKQPDPVMMTPQQRHNYTVKVWMESKGFKWDGEPLTDDKLKEMGRMTWPEYKAVCKRSRELFAKKYDNPSVWALDPGQTVDIKHKDEQE